MIGTDGVSDLIEVAQRPLPGRTEPVGPIEQFWSKTALASGVWIQQRLDAINHQTARPDPENGGIRHDLGLLPDDTTIIALRRT
jgi:hypothetical protein